MAPSESDWETHKSLIQSLYLSTTLKETMERMEENHNFVASKMQYTNRLKKWGSRKYISKEETEYVLQRKRKREEDGKESEVIWRGTVLSELKLKKAASRSSISDLNQLDFLNPPTPEGMLVRTPPNTEQQHPLVQVEYQQPPTTEVETMEALQQQQAYVGRNPESDTLGIIDAQKDLKATVPGTNLTRNCHQPLQTCKSPSYSHKSTSKAPQKLRRVDLEWLWCKFQTMPTSLFENYQSEDQSIQKQFLDKIYDRSFLEATAASAACSISSQDCAKVVEAVSEEGQESPFDLYFLSYILDGL